MQSSLTTSKNMEQGLPLLSEDEQLDVTTESALVKLFNEEILQTPSLTRLQKNLGLVGGACGAISFSFAGVLGYNFGADIPRILGWDSNIAGVGSGMVFSGFAFVPLAVLCGVHAKNTFESIPSLFSADIRPYFPKKSIQDKIWQAFYASGIVILGSLAAADSTTLTNTLVEPFIGEAVYPLEAITQVAMTILRGWALDNFITIGHNAIKRPLELKFGSDKVRAIAVHRYYIMDRINHSIFLLRSLPEAVVEQLHQRIINERLVSTNLLIQATHTDVMLALVRDLANLDESPELTGITLPEERTHNTRKLFMLLGALIGAVSINGFIPPALELGANIGSFFGATDDVTFDGLGYVFAASISACFGSLTFYATALMFGNLYVVLRSFSFSNAHASDIFNSRTLLTALSLFAAACSAIPAMQLSLQYVKGSEALKQTLAVVAFIGLTATDYQPLGDLIRGSFEGHSKREQLITVAERTNTAVSKFAGSVIPFFSNSVREENRVGTLNPLQAGMRF